MFSIRISLYVKFFLNENTLFYYLHYQYDENILLNKLIYTISHMNQFIYFNKILKIYIHLPFANVKFKRQYRNLIMIIKGILTLPI